TEGLRRCGQGRRPSPLQAPLAPPLVPTPDADLVPSRRRPEATDAPPGQRGRTSPPGPPPSPLKPEASLPPHPRDDRPERGSSSIERDLAPQRGRPATGRYPPGGSGSRHG